MSHDGWTVASTSASRGQRGELKKIFVRKVENVQRAHELALQRQVGLRLSFNEQGLSYNCFMVPI